MVFISEYFLFSLLAFLFFIVSLIKWFYSSSELQNNLLPSPRKLPIIGNLHQLGSVPHRSLQSLSQKYGPLMLLHFGSRPVLVVSSANAASQIFKTHDIVFSDRPKSVITHKLFYKAKSVSTSSYGEYWRQMRSFCVLQLLSNQRDHSFQRVREEETALMIEKISRKCLSSSSALINLSDIFITLTNDIVRRVALGKKYGDEEKGKKAKKCIAEFMEILMLGAFHVGFYFPWLAWINRFNGLDARAEKVVAEIDGFIESVIQEHENKAKTLDDSTEKTETDFVDVLLETQRENLTGFPIERDSMKALILVTKHKYFVT